MASSKYDIYIAGLGGQGVLTIGEIITAAAFSKGIPVNFYPTKGMSQRGGFVKAQLRLGTTDVGPNIPQQGADLAISMECSETLKIIRYVKPDADFLFYGFRWEPTAVMLGKAPYPTLKEIWQEIEKADARVTYLAPEALPKFKGRQVRGNLYVLGAAMARTGLKDIFQAEDIIAVVNKRWPQGAEENIFAFQAGLSADVFHDLPGNY